MSVYNTREGKFRKAKKDYHSICGTDQIRQANATPIPILKIAKNSNFAKKLLHATHLLKLLDKMYKYEMDPTRAVGATEQTRAAGRMDGWTD